MFEGTEMSYEHKLVSADTPEQNIWQKVTESSKIWQGQKVLISPFA